MSLRLRYDPKMDHYDVLTGSWVCGIIQHEEVADDHPSWRWIIQIGGDIPEDAEFDGYAATLGEAKVAFARNLAHLAGVCRPERSGCARRTVSSERAVSRRSFSGR